MHSPGPAPHGSDLPAAPLPWIGEGAARNATCLLLGGLFLYTVLHMVRHFVDYPVYELAGRRVLEGRPQDLYDVHRQTPGGFYYPYFFALCFAPVAALGPLGGRVAVFVIFWLSYARLLTFSVRSAAELVPAADTPRMRALIAAGVTIAAVNPLNDAFLNANIGLPLAAMVIQAWEWRERRALAARVLVAAAIAFKVYPVIVLAWFVWARLWLVVATALAALALFMAAPIPVYGPQVGMALLRDQAYVLSHFGTHWPYDSLIFQNVHASLMRWGSLLALPGATVFHWSLALASLTMIGFYAPSFLRPSPAVTEEFRLRMFLVCLAAVPLIVPVSWYNMALFYLPVLAVLLAQGLAERDRLALWSVLLFFAAFTLTGRDVVGRQLARRLQFVGVPFLGAALVVGVFVVGLVRRHRPAFQLRPDSP